MILPAEDPSTRANTFPRATLSTTNFTWIILASNRGLRVDRLAMNYLRYGKNPPPSYFKFS
jgi:hypothetical protein